MGGSPVAQIIKQFGESSFRDYEVCLFSFMAQLSDF